MAANILEFDELSRDQVIVNNLAIDENYVVTGGPGSGKTMLALLRASKIVEEHLDAKGEEPSVLFIVYNRPLYTYLCEHVEEVGLSEDDFNTYHTWLSDIYKSKVPGKKSAPKMPGEKWVHDWETIVPDLIKLYDQGDLYYDYILVDEAQIVPIELISVLNQISDHMTVFMDKNQTVLANGSDPDEVVNEICNAPGRRKILQRNHRNSEAILDFSMLFRDKRDQPEEAINKGGIKPELKNYGHLEDIAEDIADYASDHPTELIGVFVDDWKERNSLFKILKDTCDSNGSVQKYVSMREKAFWYNEFDFEPGIKVLHHWVMTGLEFDSVFVPRVDSGFFDETDQKRSMLLVATTRARTNLVLGYENDDKRNKYPLNKILGAHDLVVEVA